MWMFQSDVCILRNLLCNNDSVYCNETEKSYLELNLTSVSSSNIILILILKITNSMGQRLWEATSHLGGQEILRFIWNPKVRYHVHKSLPQVPILSHINSVHNFPSCFFKIHSNTLPSMPRPFKLSLPFRFPYQNFVHISPLTHTCYMHRPSHPPSLDHLIIFGEAYKLWSSSLFSLPQPPATSSTLGRNFYPCTLDSNTLILCRSFNVRDQVSHFKWTCNHDARQRYSADHNWNAVHSKIVSAIQWNSFTVVSFIERLGYRLDEMGSIPGGCYDGIFFLYTTTMSTPLLGPNQHPIQMLLGDSFSGGKAAGAWSWPVTSSSAEVKNPWNYTSTPQVRLHGMMLS
jgi:hypothetical protein